MTVSARDRRTQDTPAEKSRKRLVASAIVPKRSYGSGRLFVYTDKAGVESWYGSWRVGGRRVQRKIGLKREPGGSYGLTRVQAERELRKRMETDLVLATPERKTVGVAPVSWPVGGFSG